MKKNVIIILFSCFISISLFGQINVIPVTDTVLQIKKNAIPYYLPMKSFEVSVDVETYYFVAGPFNKYAEKYLSLKDASTVNSSYSDVTGVEISEFVVPDPNAGFFVFNTEKSLVLDDLGVLVSYNSPTDSKDIRESKTVYNHLNFPADDILFTDYSVKRNFIGLTDTTYKVVELDSVFQKIPVYNTVITSKDFEQKAEEAANFIIKLRKHRFKLQTGQFETEKAPKDLEFMIQELDELEKQYLELFVGKTVMVKNTFKYNYVPSLETRSDSKVMFYVSDDLGIVLKNSGDDIPVRFIYEDLNSFTELENFYGRQIELKEKEKKKGLYYRIPGNAKLSIEFDNHMYAYKNIIVPQIGVLNHLPAKLFKNKDLQIIFDNNTGSIKSIINE